MAGSAGGNAPTRNVPATGSIFVAWDGTGLAPENASVVLRTGGIATVSCTVTGDFSGDLIPEATGDGTNWVELKGEDAAHGVPIDDITLPMVCRFSVSSFVQFRLRCVSYASGSAMITLQGSVAPINLLGQITSSIGQLAAANQQMYTAGQTISGHSIVRLTNGLIYPADAVTDSVSTLQSVIGMTTGAIAASAQGAVTRAGLVAGMSGLTANSVYFLGSNGTVTSLRPTSGTLLIVGTGVDPGTFNVRISPPGALN